MRTLNAVILFAAVVGGACGCRSTPPAAAVSDKAAVANKVIACGGIRDETERYRCYDGVNASMRPATAAKAVAVAPTSAAAGPAIKTAAVPDDRVGEEYLAPTTRRSTPPAAAVHSSIASVDQVRPSIYVIKLANGQVWRHTGVETMAFFRVGDNVNIEREMLGSYHMWSEATGGTTNWVRVTRDQ